MHSQNLALTQIPSHNLPWLLHEIYFIIQSINNLPYQYFPVSNKTCIHQLISYGGNISHINLHAQRKM